MGAGCWDICWRLNPCHIICGTKSGECKLPSHMHKEDHLSNEVSLRLALSKSGVSVACKSRAIAAIDRLLGGVVDIPNAYIDSVADRIRTESEQELKKMVAKGDAKIDEYREQLSAGLSKHMAARELKKVANKRRIAERAIKVIEDEPGQEESSATTELDEDWLNHFQDYAEKASSEELQQLWARVLAGKIRKPKSFSLSTLRFMSEVDQETALLFEKETKYWLAGGFIVKPPNLIGERLLGMIFLEEVGLLQDVNGQLRNTIEMKRNAIIFMREGNYNLVLKALTNITYNVIRISRIGREILDILPTKDHFAVLEHVFESMSGKITYASINAISEHEFGSRFNVVKVLKEETIK